MKYKILLLFLMVELISSIVWGGTLTICKAPRRQLEPNVASDTKDYLVVWEDKRDGAVPLDIYGRIVKGSGALLDTFAIFKDPQPNWYPRVVWNGDQYLVIWSWNEQVIYGRYVDSGGNLTDPHFAIADGGGLKRHLGMASNGENHLVLWTHCEAGEQDIYGHLVSKVGDTLGPRFPIATESGIQAFPNAAAIASKNYIVVWEDERSGDYDIYCQKISSDGSLIGGESIICNKSEPQEKPVIAVAGDTIIVVWEEDDGPIWIDYNIWCATLDTSFNVISGASNVCFESKDQRDPAVTKSPTFCEKGRFLASWHDYRDSPTNKSDVYYIEINGQGSCENETRMCYLDGTEWKTNIATMDCAAIGGFLVVWEDRNEIPTDTSNIRGYIWECPIGVEENENANCKLQSALGGAKLEAYPNPFTAGVRVQISDTRYQNPDIRHPTSDLSLKIYDLSGRLVRTLIPNPLSLTTAVEWDGKDEEGKEVRPGVYFVKPSYKPCPALKIIKIK